MFSAYANQDFRDRWHTLSGYELKLDNINIAPARSTDGPITKQIAEWLGKGDGKGYGRGKGKGRGRGADAETRGAKRQHM